jgi:delta1-piperideine-2-carboxylate reductase
MWGSMSRSLTFSELTDLVAQVLARHGFGQENAYFIAQVVAAAERDGSFSHGLTRLNGYVSTLKSGWADGTAVPDVRDAAPGLVVVDANNGFAQIALAKGRALLLEKVSAQGVAALTIKNSHHFAALWPDIEPFAENRLIALTTINTRSYMIVWGGKKKILGTNPMAFACPRQGHPPIIWDQASSPMSHGDLLLASKNKRQILPGVAVDADGNPTIDPDEVLKGGAFLPFGGHKGSALAFMIEILSAATTGGRFGFDDRVADFPGGKTSHAGQFVMVLDPVQTAGEGFFDRVEGFVNRLKASGVARLPGDHRYARRQRAESEGIPILSEHYETIQNLLR